MRQREHVVDELLVLATQAGHTDAFEQLARRWHPRLLRHALRLTGDPDGAREAAQETWAVVARSISRLKDPACFGPWALRIAGRRCAVKLLTTDTLSHTIRWGVGAIFGWLAVMGGKTWYWMQTERVAMTREIKRVELLVAQLSRELSSDR